MVVPAAESFPEIDYRKHRPSVPRIRLQRADMDELVGLEFAAQGLHLG